MQQYKLHLGTIEDYDTLFRLSQEFLAESSFKELGVDLEKLSHNIMYYIQEPKHLIVIVTRDDSPVGFLAAGISMNDFTHHTVASEKIWYVKPKYRHTSAAYRLFLAFEEWAKRNDCDFCAVTSLSTTSDHVDTFYKKKGYAPIEQSYLKPLTKNLE